MSDRLVLMNFMRHRGYSVKAVVMCGAFDVEEVDCLYAAEISKWRARPASGSAMVCMSQIHCNDRSLPVQQFFRWPIRPEDIVLV